MQRRQFIATGMGAALSASLAPLSAWAQDSWPSRPIKLIVPFPPGGPTDIMGRTAAKVMSDKLGQQLVVENKAGAGGNIGTDAVAKAAGDGYTIGLSAISSLAIAPTLSPKLPFSVDKDLAPVSLVGFTPCAIVAHPSAPFDDLKGLIAYAKANPGKVLRASGGSGTSMHLTGELFRSQAQVDMPHVPYKGSAPALTDLAGGHVQVMFDSLMTAMPLVKAGKLKALGVTGATRSPIAPDVPTIAEQGLKGYQAFGWIGVVAPKGTPRPVLDILAKAVAEALKDPKIRETLIAQGAEPVGSTPDAFGSFIADQTKLWAAAVKASGARVE